MKQWGPVVATVLQKRFEEAIDSARCGQDHVPQQDDVSFLRRIEIDRRLAVPTGLDDQRM